MPDDSIPLYDAMSQLRAVRRLRNDPIPDAALRRILQAAAWAPSGGNLQPWRTIVVRDPEKRRRLGELYRGQWRRYRARYDARLEGLVGPERAREERTLAAADHLGEHLGDAPVLLVFCFHPDRMAITDAELGRPSVVGGGSVYPAIENLMLACVNEGIGCTLTTLLCFEEAAVRELLVIPEDWFTCAVLPLGVPVGTGHGPIRRRPLESLCYADAFGNELSLDA